jgi:hypothetical protein
VMGQQALGNLHQHLSFVQHGSPWLRPRRGGREWFGSS